MWEGRVRSDFLNIIDCNSILVSYCGRIKAFINV